MKMKYPVCLLCCVAIMWPARGQRHKTPGPAARLEHMADSLSRICQYHRVADYYSEAARLYAEKGGWLPAARNYRLAGNSLLAAGRYDAAAGAMQEALRLLSRRERSRSGRGEGAEIRRSLAMLAEKRGKYADEMSLCNQALGTIRATNAIAQQGIAALWNQKGRAYQYLGKYDSARYCYEKALQLRINLLGDNHIETAESYACTGELYIRTSNPDSAAAYLEKALAIRLRALCPQHPDIAASYNSLGTLYLERQKFDSAMAYHEKALQILVHLWGEQHIDVAATDYYIGFLSYRKGQYDKALAYSQKALPIQTTALGEQHPVVADTYNIMGVIYHTKKEYDNALTHFQKALQIRMAAFGEQHPDVASGYYNMGVIYKEKDEFAQALKHYEKALTIRIATLGNQHKDVAASYRGLGNLFLTKGQYNKALEYHQKSLNIQRLIYGELHPDVALNYYNIGVTWYNKGEYDKALQYLTRALHIRIAIYGETHRYVANSYASAGIMFQQKGDYEKALEYHQKALQIQITMLGEQHTDVAENYNNIAGIFEAKRDLDKALEYCHKALQIRIATLGEQHNKVAYCYNNIGNIYKEIKKHGEALEYYQKALQIRTTALGKQHPNVAYCYNNIGDVYIEQHEPDTALAYYQKALEINISTYGKHHPGIADGYNNLGETWLQKGAYHKALPYFQKAIMANVTGFTDTAIYQNPMFANENITSIKDQWVFLRTLTSKAHALYRQYQTASHTAGDIRAALAAYQLAFRVIHSLRSGYNRENARLLLSEKTKRYYAQAIQAALACDRANPSPENKALAFQFMEQAKAATLAARFNEYDAIHLAGIPDSLITAEKEARTELAYIATEIAKEKDKQEGYDTLAVQALENEQFRYGRQLDSLLDAFETHYPAYYRLKHERQTATINDIQQSLDKHTALLDYFVADSSLLIATITDSLFTLREVPIDSSFKKQVIAYYRDTRIFEFFSLTPNSLLLYKKLVKPVKKDIAGKNRLVVIPDDYLHYVPFETLIDHKTPPKIDNPDTDFAKLNYLIRSYAITYHYAASLWRYAMQQGMRQTGPTNSHFIGFAPVFDKKTGNDVILSENFRAIDTAGTAFRSITADGKHLNALPYSKQEVTDIVRLFAQQDKEAKAYLYTQASEENFKKEAGQYRYVHIASHGFGNDTEPRLSGIAFSQPTDTSGIRPKQKDDGMLYTGEAYNLQLQADLVALSACQGGVGRLVTGEGIQGLARGFLYAGTPNVIFSLWNASDNHTREIMVSFYAHVLNGKSYAEALRLAKLKIFSTTPFLAHPFFWAQFVVVGR